MRGKWSKAGIPHKGWSCYEIEDLEALDAVCEMCETQKIRYVHFMQHPDLDYSLRVGCVCAGRMEEDYVAPKMREKHLRKRQRWLKRRWRTSSNGNAYLNNNGLNIVIFPKKNGKWGGVIKDIKSGEKEFSKLDYATEDQAKLQAFERVNFLQTNFGWGS